MSDTQTPQTQVVQTAWSFTPAQMAPWFLLVLVLAFFLGKGMKTEVTPVVPVVPVTPVTPLLETNVEKLDAILTLEEGLYLSSVCKNVSMLIAKDGEKTPSLLTNTKDVQKLVSNAGLVVTLDHPPYIGLGAILSTYFDEDSEFPQKVQELTKESRLMAVTAWLKMSEDLAKVK